MFAKEGAKIVVGYIKDVGGEETAAVRASGGEAVFIHTLPLPAA